MSLLRCPETPKWGPDCEKKKKTGSQASPEEDKPVGSGKMTGPGSGSKLGKKLGIGTLRVGEKED